MDSINENTRVSCTDCIHWEHLKKNQEKYFGCQVLCNKCPCGECSCYDPTSTRKFSHRPKFILKEKEMVNL